MLRHVGSHSSNVHVLKESWSECIACGGFDRVHELLRQRLSSVPYPYGIVQRVDLFRCDAPVSPFRAVRELGNQGYGAGGLKDLLALAEWSSDSMDGHPIAALGLIIQDAAGDGYCPIIDRSGPYRRLWLRSTDRDYFPAGWAFVACKPQTASWADQLKAWTGCCDDPPYGPRPIKKY